MHSPALTPEFWAEYRQAMAKAAEGFAKAVKPFNPGTKPGFFDRLRLGLAMAGFSSRKPGARRGLPDYLATPPPPRRSSERVMVELREEMQQGPQAPPLLDLSGNPKPGWLPSPPLSRAAAVVRAFDALNPQERQQFRRAMYQPRGAAGRIAEGTKQPKDMGINSVLELFLTPADLKEIGRVLQQQIENPGVELPGYTVASAGGAFKVTIRLDKEKREAEISRRLNEYYAALELRGPAGPYYDALRLSCNCGPFCRGYNKAQEPESALPYCEAHQAAIDAGAYPPAALPATQRGEAVASV